MGPMNFACIAYQKDIKSNSAIKYHVSDVTEKDIDCHHVYRFKLI